MTKSKILIIEDDKVVRVNLEFLLKNENYQVICAKDGEEGIKYAKESSPDLIICDIMMPKYNGYQVLEAIRTNEDTSLIPFIFLTAKGTRYDQRKGMNLGADDYITKPFNLEDVLKSVHARLEKKDEISEQIEKIQLDIGKMLPHELRTPLTTIKGYTDILTEANMLQVDLDTVVEWARIIQESEKKLERIAENYSLYASFVTHEKKSSEMVFWRNRERIFARPIIETAVNQKAERAGRAEDVTYRLNNFTFVISVNAFMKILEEIMDNAFKFSPKGSPIQIFNKIKDNHVYITIKDHGCGMTNHQIKNIGPFKQFNRDKNEQQGSGLGLYIARYLIELNNGELIMESENDQGTSVTLKFPCDQ